MEENNQTKSKYEIALSKYNINLNDNEIAGEVDKLVHDNIAKNNTKAVKEFLFNCIDLTSLNCTDCDTSIMKFTENVNKFDDEFPDLKNVASIC
ncbi:MAG: deoxyribose-phosphate aldolase, partial [Bacteroidaceae bacterium]